MKSTGSWIRRTMTKEWLAGIAALTMSVAARAESPQFNTRGTPAQQSRTAQTSPAADQSKPAANDSAGSLISLASVETWINGAKNTAPANGHSAANNCAPNDCREGICDNMYIFGAVNSWRGPLDGSGQNSYGFVSGFNAGVPVAKDYGLGFQFGMSYGLYDFHGRDDFGPESEPSSIEEQLFLTTGFFRRCVQCCDPCASRMDRVSWGLVYDYMITDNTGAAAAELDLGQIRGQVGYCLDAANEIGLQGSISDGSDDEFNALNVRHTTRSIDQISLFWHHVCCTGLETRVYTGWAEELGDWLIGANAEMPINSCWSLFGGFTYIMPSSTGGADGSREEFWNVSAGFAYYPGGNAIATSVCRSRWMPLMPVADNGSFALDLGF